MTLPDIDLFFFWRRVLMIAVSIYALVRLAQSAWTWRCRLTGPGRGLAIARQYLLVQLLRISPRPFAWELVELAIWAAVLLALSGAHRLI